MDKNNKKRKPSRAPKNPNKRPTIINIDRTIANMKLKNIE